MGQKVSPTGFRLVTRKKWLSNWFANKQEFGNLISEDSKIRKYLMAKPACQGASRIQIKRMSGKIEVTIITSRPGLVIGKKGAEIDVLKGELRNLTSKEVWIEVEEIKRPDLDAKLVADGIAKQLERRIPFRRILKKADDPQKVLEYGNIIVKETDRKEEFLSIHSAQISIMPMAALKRPMDPLV